MEWGTTKLQNKHKERCLGKRWDFCCLTTSAHLAELQPHDSPRRQQARQQDTQRRVSRLSLWILLLFLPNSVDHVGPDKLWEMSLVQASTSEPVLWSLVLANHALPRHQRSGEPLGVPSCYVALGLRPAPCFQWSHNGILVELLPS